ncbi:MAG: hypothetical protein VYB44_16365 [Bacteroidota bacterium]|nr:hypothetical protein [Bacteroidota bacterium]
MSNLDTLSTPVIFTEIGDLKLFSLQIGGQNLANNLIFVDRNNEISALKPYSIYPRILHFENKKLVKIENYAP